MAGFMLKGGAGGTHWARPARRVPSEQGVRDVHMLPLHAAEPGAEQGVALRVVAAVDRATILTSAGEVGGGGGGIVRRGNQAKRASMPKYSSGSAPLTDRLTCYVRRQC